MEVYACTNCDYESMSTKYNCPKCRTGQLAAKQVSSQGTVYSFTDIHIAPTEFADIAPYTVALIQLDESDVKVTVRMEKSVEIDDKVDLDHIKEGAYLYKKV